MHESLKFDPTQYTTQTLELDGQTVTYRAFEGISYEEKPADGEFQKLNLFAPEAFFAGESVNGYNIRTAPIFMPNTVGGYRPGPADQPGGDRNGGVNSIFQALGCGYVVASPGLRGNGMTDAQGKLIGTAPAVICDYKAAVRWLRHNRDLIPGDTEKIITNGTSAGGALSALMGATGNHPDYEPELAAIGAAEGSDHVFAASCYCPITNLDHADMAYEWEFLGVNDYHRKHMRRDEGGRPSFTAVDGEMSELQIKTSRELAAQFPAYLNSLHLRDEQGRALRLDGNGGGTFQQYIEQVVLASAQRAIDRGTDVSGKTWLTVENGRAVRMDFAAYVREITRMKTAPAFDDLTMKSPENNLFGTDAAPYLHFTSYSRSNSLEQGGMADAYRIRMMNPMDYLADVEACKAPHWRIRHGECDRDTSLAISAILALKLRELGCAVDYHSPWNIPHAGDYDLDELFAWIDGICRD